MKFIVSSAHLLDHLNRVSGVIPTNAIVPILENFLFQIKAGKLTITASDLQTSVVTEMEIEAKEEGQIAVPAKTLIDTLRNLAEQPITFTIDEGSYTIELSSDNGRYKLSGENATDFPKIPDVSDGYKLDLSTSVLIEAISNTQFAASTDELRPAMTGVLVKFEDSNTTFVATDGHRLVRYRRLDLVSDSGTTILIPKKAISHLQKALPTENQDCTIEFNPSNALFSFGNFKFICRLIDEKFPDYESVIPPDNPFKLTVDREEFLGSLKRISLYANKTTNQIVLKINGSELQISAEDLDFSNEANERLACEYSGDNLEIGFNARFLIEMLNNLHGDKIDFNLSAPNKAGILVPNDMAEAEDLIMLVMPVMLTNYS
jgi:DNA polymerase III subunit beta